METEKQLTEKKEPEGPLPECGFSVNWRMIDAHGQEVQITQRAAHGSDWKGLLIERSRMIEAALKFGWKPLVKVGNFAEQPPIAATPATSAPTPPASADGEIRVCAGTTIIKKVNDDGKTEIRIKCKPFEKFGVALYPEAMETMGINPDSLPFGPSPFPHKVLVKMSEENKPKRIEGYAA